MNKDKINNIITNKDLGVMDLRIFIYMLNNKGSYMQSKLSEIFNISPGVIHRACQKLLDANIIKVEKVEGRNIFYTLV